MRWTEEASGGVLELRASRARAVFALHVLLLDGQTWAYWATENGAWLGLVSVGHA
jgi:hypothetical protein